MFTECHMSRARVQRLTAATDASPRLLLTERSIACEIVDTGHVGFILYSSHLLYPFPVRMNIYNDNNIVIIHVSCR